MLGVTLNGNHTGTEWGLHWTSCDVSEPVPITSYVDIPGRKTKLDATESLFGSVTYENRTITLGFWAKTTWAQWMALTSKIQTAIGGRWCKIVLDTEPDKYWMGRVTVSSSMSADNPVLSFYTIKADVEPFKYWTEQPSGTDWLWDPFSFVNGMIQNLNDIQVTGSKTQAVVGKDTPCTPTVTATAAMTLTVSGKTYNLVANTPLVLTDVVLYKGTTNFAFTGTGKVTISFRGETL